MEKEYKDIALFFAVIAAIVLIGFFPTYFSHFPNFEGKVPLHHFHAFVMILWLVVLIVQPILINKRKYHWHRMIGKFSYVLVPVIVITMVLAYKRSFFNSIDENGIDHIKSLSMLFLPLTDILPFTVFYLLAIIYRKKVANHLRFMISTAIVVGSAGIVRICMVWLGMDFVGAMYANAVLMILVLVGLALYDLYHKKLSENKSFVVALLVLGIPNLLLMYVPYTTWWQSFAEGIIKAMN